MPNSPDDKDRKAITRAIGKKYRKAYEHEPLPERMAELLEKLRAQEQAATKKGMTDEG